MNDMTQISLPSLPLMVRWSARCLSALLLLFWGYFMVASSVGDAAHSSRPLHANDYLIMTTLGISLTGLGLVWKWELTGALLALGAISLCALANWRVLVFPGTLIPLTACLFLLSWWINKTRFNE